MKIRGIKSEMLLPTTAPHLVDGDAREVDAEFEQLVNQQLVSWTIEYQVVRKLGAGGQGVVLLAQRLGSDGLKVPVALKFFSRTRYPDPEQYQTDMGRVAHIAARVGRIQQDHLLDVYNLVDHNGIRVMTMEWIDGFDLKHLLSPDTLRQCQRLMGDDGWSHLNNVVITPGTQQSRLKAGVAIAILRECLAAIAALHRDGIIHGDIKPANIMLKRTGNAKIIDYGSACQLDHVIGLRPFTPQYAAPEVLEEGACTPYSDLASLGYVLVEMLAGQAPFAGIAEYGDLVKAKRDFVQDLEGLLPDDVLASDSLMRMIRILVQPDPLKRFPSAEAADLLEFGAANFQRELVVGNLASEYEHDIRVWLQELP